MDLIEKLKEAIEVQFKIEDKILEDADKLIKENAALRAENERLKAALNKIVQQELGQLDGDFCTTSVDCWACEETKEIAVNALKPPETDAHKGDVK